MISAQILGVEAMLRRLEAMPTAISNELRKEMERLTIKLQRTVKEDKLSGQVLHVRTNILRSSITKKVEESNGKLTGIVGTKVHYAAFHEFGFSGLQKIKEHLRISRSGNLFTVRAHDRQVNYGARSFLRSALSEMVPEIKQRLTEAVKRGLRL